MGQATTAGCFLVKTRMLYGRSLPVPGEACCGRYCSRQLQYCLNILAGAGMALHVQEERLTDLPRSLPGSIFGLQNSKHDACLAPLDHGAGLPMRQPPPQLVYESSLQKPYDGLHSVTALACCPVSSRVCVATKDRFLRFLGGPQGTEETFLARAADRGKPLHLVSGMTTNLCFPSPSGSTSAPGCCVIYIGICHSRATRKKI